jgi:hypothetical protein
MLQLKHPQIILIILALFLAASPVLASEPTQQFNKLYMTPFYRESMTHDVTYNYSINVNPPDKISSVLNAIVSFNAQINGQSQLFILLVNNQSCNTVNYTVATAFSTTGNMQFFFDCSNVITASRNYSITLKSTVNTGAITGWIDLTYMNNPMGTMNVFGTEYTFGETGTLFLQLKDSNLKPINNKVCLLSIYSPVSEHFPALFGSTIMDHVQMNYLQNSSGMYYYDFIAPNVSGVYMSNANCFYKSNYYRGLSCNIWDYEVYICGYVIWGGVLVAPNWTDSSPTQPEFQHSILNENDNEYYSLRSSGTQKVINYVFEMKIPASIIDAIGTEGIINPIIAYQQNTSNLTINLLVYNDCSHKFERLITPKKIMNRGVNVPSIYGNQYLNFMDYIGIKDNNQSWQLAYLNATNMSCIFILNVNTTMVPGGEIYNNTYNFSLKINASSPQNINLWLDMVNVYFYVNSSHIEELGGTGEIHVSDALKNQIADFNSSINNLGSTYIGGTEYISNQSGLIAVRLISASNTIVTGAVCNVSIFYPNRSIWLNMTPMTELDSGIYYYNFSIPNTTGVYIYSTDCTKTGQNYRAMNTFHVSSVSVATNDNLQQNITDILTYLKNLNITVTDTYILTSTINSSLIVLNLTVTNGFDMLDANHSQIISLIENDVLDELADIWDLVDYYGVLTNKSLVSINSTLYNMSNSLTIRINYWGILINTTQISILNAVNNVNDTQIVWFEYINNSLQNISITLDNLNFNFSFSSNESINLSCPPINYSYINETCAGFFSKNGGESMWVALILILFCIVMAEVARTHYFRAAAALGWLLFVWYYWAESWFLVLVVVASFYMMYACIKMFMRPEEWSIGGR